jgi:hypothetical protein
MGQMSWGNLYDYAPSEEGLAPTFAYEGGLNAAGSPVYDADPSLLLDMRRSPYATLDRDTQGSREYQRMALAQLENALAHERGGVSAIDRAALTQTQAAQAAAVGTGGRAADAAMYSRGLGGSGAAMLASMASQGAAGMQGAGDAGAVAGAGVQRVGQMQDQYANTLGNLRDQSMAEQMARRGAVEDLMRFNMDYRRGARFRDLDRSYQQGRARSSAAQRAYQNKYAAFAGWNEDQLWKEQQAHQDDLAKREAEMQAIEGLAETAGSLASAGGGGGGGMGGG